MLLYQIFNYPGKFEHSGTPLGTTEAIVEINGCDLDGKANTSLTTGWDWGIYSYGLGDTNVTASNFDYTSIFGVTVTGTTLSNFEEGGIFGFTSISARGLYSVNGGSLIENTGSHLASSTKPYLHSGIYLENYESYLGIEGYKMQSKGNLGNGIFAFSDAAIGNGAIYESGLFIGLEACELSSNNQAGIEMRVQDYLPSESVGGRAQQPAIVGGTWSEDPIFMGRSLHGNGSEPMWGVIPLGQGYLNRCLIHDNDGPGVYAKIQGRGISLGHSICNRLVNSFLWNNAGGGFLAELDPKSSNPSDPPGDLLVMPNLYFGILNSTFVSNGSALSDYSIEVIDFDGTGANLKGNYSWTEGLAAPFDHLATRLLTSIFDRNGLGNGVDFGPNLDLKLVKDESGPNHGNDPTPLPWQIGGAALAGTDSSGFDLSNRLRVSTSFAAPYKGGSTYPDLWYLDKLQVNFALFDLSLDTLSIIGTEHLVDYRLNGRPGIALGQNDKGAEQAQ